MNSVGSTRAHEESQHIEGRERRRSCRAFLKQEVASELVQSVVEAAGYAPSWCNTQPWTIYHVRGDARDRLSEALLIAAKARDDAPDLAFPEEYAAPYAARKAQADSALQKARDIRPHEIKRLVDAVYSNWRFFEAPQVLVLTTPKSLVPYSLVDAGCFIHALLTELDHHRLGGCAQASIAQFSHVVRRVLSVPEDEAIVCGISIGYPDLDAAGVFCDTDRAPVAELLNVVS